MYLLGSHVQKTPSCVLHPLVRDRGEAWLFRSLDPDPTQFERPLAEPKGLWAVGVGQQIHAYPLPGNEHDQTPVPDAGTLMEENLLPMITIFDKPARARTEAGVPEPLWIRDMTSPNHIPLGGERTLLSVQMELAVLHQVPDVARQTTSRAHHAWH